MIKQMHSTEIRGYRELILAVKQLQKHWGVLAECLDEGACMDALHFGAHRSSSLLRELDLLAEQNDIPVGPSTLGAGRLMASLRSNVQDLFLERNQAIRLAALDLEHVSVLLEYLAALARHRNASKELELLERWLPRIADLREKLLAGISELAADPDRAVLAMHPGTAGRLGNRISSILDEYGKRADRRWGQHTLPK